MVREFERDYQLALDESGYQNFVTHGASLMVNATLPTGKYQVHTVIRDSSSGKIGSQREDLDVPSYTPDAPYMSSLVLANQLGSANPAVDKPVQAREAYNPFKW